MRKAKKDIILSDLRKVKECLLDLGSLASKNDFFNYGKCEQTIIFLINNIKQNIEECK